MNTLQRIPSVFFFEWRRALTIPRLAWMVALMAFPPGLLLMISSAAQRDPPIEVAAILVYALSPCVACMMSVFLWATPVLSAELEGRSWVYLAVRPYGPVAVLLGKYLVSISWAVPVGLVSATVGSYIIGREQVFHMVSVECGLATLSCLSYAAVFLLIGVIAPKRAMVAGILYAVVFEAGAALIPAAVTLFRPRRTLIGPQNSLLFSRAISRIPSPEPCRRIWPQLRPAHCAATCHPFPGGPHAAAPSAAAVA